MFSPKNGLNITIITKIGEKILMSISGFFGNLYFLTGGNIKFYQKSNSLPKNNLIPTFSRKCFAKKSKNNGFWIEHVLTRFITL